MYQMESFLNLMLAHVTGNDGCLDFISRVKNNGTFIRLLVSEKNEGITNTC